VPASDADLGELCELRHLRSLALHDAGLTDARLPVVSGRSDEAPLFRGGTFFSPAQRNRLAGAFL
jgi:hypothetical protein